MRDFQHIAGHLNWALNVYPHLRPGLCALYAKTAGKLFQKALLWVNRDVGRELTWVADHLLCSDGIYFPLSVSWSYDDLSPSVLHVYCNASPFAMGFWYPLLLRDSKCQLTRSSPSKEDPFSILRLSVSVLPFLMWRLACCQISAWLSRTHRQHQHCPALQLAFSTTCIQLDVDSGC